MAKTRTESRRMEQKDPPKPTLPQAVECRAAGTLAMMCLASSCFVPAPLWPSTMASLHKLSFDARARPSSMA